MRSAAGGSRLERSARLELAVERTLEAMTELITELRVTNEEWHAVLHFLTEVGSHDEFVLLSDVNGLSVLVDRVTHEGGDATATPSNVLGPFFRPGAPILETPARISRSDEPGEPMVLAGAVRSTSGAPLPGALLDVWQTAANRLYENQDAAQPEMNLRGRVRVAPDGTYEIRTVRPVPYEIPTDGPAGRYLGLLGRHAWRPAHIHLRVEAEGHRTLTTMVYLEGDRWLSDDAIGSVKDALVIPVRTDAEGVLRSCFDVVLAPALSG